MTAFGGGHNVFQGQEEDTMNSIINDFKDKITPTPRERELMKLIARGMQNKNIAYELRISENTVRAHIGNIMRKYRLHNRTQIAVFFAHEADTSTPQLELVGSGSCPGPVLSSVSFRFDGYRPR